MFLWARNVVLLIFDRMRILSEVITVCTNKNCPLYGRPHYHCPCCGEVLVVKLEVIDEDWPFPEDYRFIKRERCTGITW